MSSRLLALGAVLAFLFALTTLPAGSLGQQPKLSAQMEKDLQPKLVTIKGKDISLPKALKMIQEQTGFEVQAEPEQDSHTLDLDKVAFWQALEALAKKWDLRVYLYGGERKITLVKHAAGWREMPLSYSGPFRLALKKVVLVRNLDDDTAAGIAYLEVAWEPRFQAFYLEAKSDSIEVRDDRGVLQELPKLERGRTPTPSGLATQIELPLPAFARRTAKIGSIKGELTMIGSPKMLNFTFDKLAKGESMTQEGVTVALRSFQAGKELWTFDVNLKYPPDGPKFESFQTWLFHNQTYLVHNTGKRVDPAGQEADEQGGAVALIRYRFISEDQKGLGKPTDWKLMYRTPGPIAEVPIKFEFKDVPLP